MSYLTLYGDRLVLEPGNFIVLYSEAEPEPTVIRGDDGGARDRFWRKKAEEWIAEHIEEVRSAVTAPKRERKTIVIETLQAAEAMAEPPIPLDVLDALLGKLAATRPDYSGITVALLREMEMQARIARRRRDMESLLLLDW